VARKRQQKRAGKGFDAYRGGTLLAEGALWLWLFSVWWIHDEAAKNPFRLPKEVVSNALILISLIGLAVRLAAVETIEGRRLLRLPVLRCLLPLVAAAGVGLVATAHPERVVRGLAALALGVGALVGWSLGLEPRKFRRFLRGLLIPASLLSVFAVLQYFGLYRPFDFVGGLESQRLGVTSFAGSAGDLAVFLVLPALLAQWELLQARGRDRWWFLAALAVIVPALVLSQTLTALVALAAGSLLLWFGLLPSRKVAAVIGVGVILLGLVVIAVEPLQQRLKSKAEDLAEGRVNHLLTGRLDGWRAAVWMFREHPLVGVGLGAYGLEFNRAKLALREQGVAFFPLAKEPTFGNAHNEYLEVAAELGLLGILALLWAGGVLLQTLRRLQAGPEKALAWAGCAAIAILSLAQFPFRLSLMAVPLILFFSWIFAAVAQEPREVP
jgi:O-antigen ligase